MGYSFQIIVNVNDGGAKAEIKEDPVKPPVIESKSEVLEPPESLYSFDQFEKDFQESQAGRLRENTIGAYIQSLRAYRDMFPDQHNIQDVKALDIQHFISERRKTISNVSLNSNIRCLQALFQYAVEWGKLDENLFSKIRKLKEPPKEINVLSREQEESIISFIQNDLKTSPKQKLKYQGMIKLGIQAGMRQGEIRNLRWKDMDLETGRIKITCREDWASKSNKNRVVFVLEDGLSCLRELFQLAGGTEEDKPFYYTSPAGYASFFSSLSKKICFKVTSHDLRRTCSSRLAEAGVNPQQHQAYLGHANISTSMKYYTSISEGCLLEAIQKTV